MAKQTLTTIKDEHFGIATPVALTGMVHLNAVKD